MCQVLMESISGKFLYWLPRLPGGIGRTEPGTRMRGRIFTVSLFELFEF